MCLLSLLLLCMCVCARERETNCASTKIEKEHFYKKNHFAFLNRETRKNSVKNKGEKRQCDFYKVKEQASWSSRIMSHKVNSVTKLSA